MKKPLTGAAARRCASSAGRHRIIALTWITTMLSLLTAQNGNREIYPVAAGRKSQISTVGLLNLEQKCSDFNSSVSLMWKNLEHKILKASYYPPKHAANKNFTDWVDTLFWSEYQVHQMRRSTFHQPDSATVLRLLEVINARVEHLKGASSYSPPLHIMVMGGSVTVGNGCGGNHVGIASPSWNANQLDCAWPSRLEYLFNEVLFQGKEVVKVSNLAGGGSSTEVGKVVLEYQLFTDEMKRNLPHAVIWAHAPNDAQEADKRAVEYTHLPGFVRAAFNLRRCDHDLPLVVMLDDFYGLGEYTSVDAISTMLFKVSSWYNLMGVSHSNVVRHKLYALFGNTTAITAILGSDWNLHPGMGSHIGVAWTVFFNFLKSFVESCEDGPSLGHGAPSSLPTKNLGSYVEKEDMETLHSRWQSNTRKAGNICELQSDFDQDVCTYAWMVNIMTGTSHPNHVQEKLNGVLQANDGWKATGNPVRQPRTGWYAQKENAMFSLKIEPAIETNFITIMSMKSYGPNFKDTRLKLILDIRNSNGTQVEKDYEIAGYHETKTSIHVPHKFELPGGGVSFGDTIYVKIELVSGSYFKINGIALCTY